MMTTESPKVIADMHDRASSIFQAAGARSPPVPQSLRAGAVLGSGRPSTPARTPGHLRRPIHAPTGLQAKFCRALLDSPFLKLPCRGLDSSKGTPHTSTHAPGWAWLAPVDTCTWARTTQTARICRQTYGPIVHNLRPADLGSGGATLTNMLSGRNDSNAISRCCRNDYSFCRWCRNDSIVVRTLVAMFPTDWTQPTAIDG